MKVFSRVILILVAVASLRAQGIQIVTDSANVVCEELQVFRDLKIYKDPGIFLSNMGMMESNPEGGWDTLASDNPLLTTVRGRVNLMRLGPPREFKNFGAIERIYEAADPSLSVSRKEAAPVTERQPTLIIPVKLCGSNDPYNDSLGFILVSDLRTAQQQKEQETGGLPPSTIGNPIPQLNKL